MPWTLFLHPRNDISVQQPARAGRITRVPFVVGLCNAQPQPAYNAFQPPPPSSLHGGGRNWDIQGSLHEILRLCFFSPTCLGCWRDDYLNTTPPAQYAPPPIINSTTSIWRSQSVLPLAIIYWLSGFRDLILQFSVHHPSLHTPVGWDVTVAESRKPYVWGGAVRILGK